VAAQVARKVKSRVVTTIALIVLMGAGLYLSFELGRYKAGFSLFDERRQAQVYDAGFAERDREIEALERQLAILETSREIDRETYSSVEANLADLQARIQAQEEELVFYRGIVSPGDGVAGLRIQTVEIDSGDGETNYLLRVLLVQAIVHNDRVTGSVRISVDGMQGGEEVAYGLNELGSESAGTDIPYGFRYFQTLELGLQLPEGFDPLTVEIQVWPRTPRGETIVQTFPWSAISQ
jgi:hypothetical protein